MIIISNGQPVYEGEQVQIGGDEGLYAGLSKHYNHPDLQALARRDRINNK